MIPLCFYTNLHTNFLDFTDIHPSLNGVFQGNDVSAIDKLAKNFTRQLTRVLGTNIPSEDDAPRLLEDFTEEGEMS